MAFTNAKVFAAAEALTEEFTQRVLFQIGEPTPGFTTGFEVDANGVVTISHAGPIPEIKDDEWDPDSALQIELLTRIYNLRAKRIDPVTGDLADPPKNWERIGKPSVRDRVSGKFEIGRGWADLMMAMIEVLESRGFEAQFDQASEKYGTLHMHCSKTPSSAEEIIIGCAESLSLSICERCGAPGDTRNDNGYVHTACEAH